MTHLPEKDVVRQGRIRRRVAARDRRDLYRARAVARLMGTDWACLDETEAAKWHHMAHEMTHLRLDGRWNNPLIIAVRMALQVDADPRERTALREATRELGLHVHEHLHFISLPPARQMAWYNVALAVGDIFPSPSDRARVKANP